MSLFIGTLAFEDESPDLMNLIKLGVIIGSLASAVVGYFLLFINPRKPH